mmetsp:Transcript_96250/g.248917  ORF Transcript_96250/g.248917 Transcript_96250/m.248917 type:complete len:501 (-) Transcript_96250:1333-2835(-)
MAQVLATLFNPVFEAVHGALHEVFKPHVAQGLPEAPLWELVEGVQVVAERAHEKHWVLRHYAQGQPQGPQSDAARVNAVEEDAPAAWLQETEHDQQQRGLAATRASTDAHLLPGLNRQPEALEDVPGGGGVTVASAEVLDLHLGAVGQPAAHELEHHLRTLALAEHLRQILRIAEGRVNAHQAATKASPALLGELRPLRRDHLETHTGHSHEAGAVVRLLKEATAISSQDGDAPLVVAVIRQLAHLRPPQRHVEAEQLLVARQLVLLLLRDVRRRELPDSMQRDELELSGTDLVDVAREAGRDREAVGQAQPRGAALDAARYQDGDETEARREAREEVEQRVVDPHLHRGLRAEAGHGAPVKVVLLLVAQLLAFAVRSHGDVVLLDLDVVLVRVRAGERGEVPHRDHHSPVGQADNEGHEVDGDQHHSEPPGHHKVDIADRDRDVPETADDPGIGDEQEYVDRSEVEGHAVHDAAGGMPVEELVDGRANHRPDGGQMQYR